MLLPASFAFWESNMFPQPTKVHSLMICKCMHQAMAIVLTTLLLSQPPQTPQDILHLNNDRLGTTMYSMPSTISTVLNASLGDFTFSHDMLLNVQWQTITCNREALVNDTLLKHNPRHINFDILFDNKSSSMTKQSKGNLPSKPLAPLKLYAFT